MRREWLSIFSLGKVGAARGVLRTLGLNAPESFIREHSPMLAAVGKLLERGGPIRVLEHGALASGSDEARWLSALCAALARKTGGESVALVFGGEGTPDAARILPVPTLAIDGTNPGLDGIAPGFDFVLQHPLAEQEQACPLYTFWTFIELEAVMRPGGQVAFTRCTGPMGQRCQYVRTYLQRLGCKPLVWGPDSVWECRAGPPAISEVARTRGVLAPLSPELQLDGPSFLRRYDQTFTSLLGSRAGTSSRNLAA